MDVILTCMSSPYTVSSSTPTSQNWHYGLPVEFSTIYQYVFVKFHIILGVQVMDMLTMSKSQIDEIVDVVGIFRDFSSMTYSQFH